MVEVDSSIEEWRPVLGFEDRYAVSNKGRVKGIARTAPNRNGERRIPEALITPTPTGQAGYHAVHLYRNNKRQVRYIHSLVLESFVGPRPEGDYQACHGILGMFVNTPENLRWDTREENNRDRERHRTAA